MALLQLPSMSGNTGRKHAYEKWARGRAQESRAAYAAQCTGHYKSAKFGARDKDMARFEGSAGGGGGGEAD
jgi:hypothetical protein